MLFGIIIQGKSIMEVIIGLKAIGGKKGLIKMIHDVGNSKPSDANLRRPEAQFGELFHEPYKLHYVYPDSRKIYSVAPYEKRLLIIDLTTIKLFHYVQVGLGQISINGKRKGGLKAIVMIKASEGAPCVFTLTKAFVNNRFFLKSISLPEGSIITLTRVILISGSLMCGQFLENPDKTLKHYKSPESRIQLKLFSFV